MFYLSEALFRIQYAVTSFFITTFFCYINKELLLFLLTFSTFSFNSKSDSSICRIYYFIYTHPLELLWIHFLVVLYFSLIFSIYALIWIALDFFKSSMIDADFFSFRQSVVRTVLFALLFNLIFVLFLFPSFWLSFQYINDSFSRDTTLSFFLELKIRDYFFFLKDIVVMMNLGFFLIIMLQLLINYQSLLTLLTRKKGLIFVNLILSTFLLSFDFLTQAFEIILLIFVFEATIFIRLLSLNFSKYFIPCHFWLRFECNDSLFNVPIFFYCKSCFVIKFSLCWKA